MCVWKKTTQFKNIFTSQFLFSVNLQIILRRFHGRLGPDESADRSFLFSLEIQSSSVQIQILHFFLTPPAIAASFTFKAGRVAEIERKKIMTVLLCRKMSVLVDDGE